MGFFQKRFGNKELKGTLNFGELLTDFHSHLIPGIDDGAQSMDDALEMIRQFDNLGFKKLITTPHIQDVFYKNTPDIILSGLEKVKNAINKAGITIKIEAAAEYLLDDGFDDKMKKGQLLTFGKKHILVELSYYNPHPNFLSFIFNLQIEGYQVIMAHPERYSYWFNDFKKFEDLKNRSVLFQLNTVSLSGHYGKDVKKIAEKMIEKDMFDYVGSDMHNQHYMDSFIKARSEKAMKKLMDSRKLGNNLL